MKLLRWLTDEEGTIIKIKSWRPWFGPYGPEWPCMLVERDHMRLTVTPVWDSGRLKELTTRLGRALWRLLA